MLVGGDILHVLAPGAVIDSLLADLSFTFRGSGTGDPSVVINLARVRIIDDNDFLCGSHADCACTK